MIVLKQTQFSYENVIVGQSNFFIRELIKIILMGDKCKQDIPHWLDNAIGAVNIVESKLSGAFLKGIISIFLGITEEKLNDRLGFIIRTELDNVTGIPYIKDRLNEIYNQKDRGIYKYRHLLSPSTIDWEDLISKLKYIALCVSRQLNPEIDNYYECLRRVETTSINY